MKVVDRSTTLVDDGEDGSCQPGSQPLWETSWNQRTRFYDNRQKKTVMLVTISFIGVLVPTCFHILNLTGRVVANCFLVEMTHGIF